MGADAETAKRLEAMLTGSTSALRAFLRPRQEGEKLYFSLDEVIVIARKPAQ